MMTAYNFSRSTRRSARRARRGFTLIEVLTAILVLAITVPPIMQAYIVASDLAAFSRQRIEALAIGQGELERIVATQDWLQGTLTGVESSSNTSYTWTVALNNWGDSTTENSTMQDLTMTVTWQKASHEYSVVLDTLVYTPDTSNSGTDSSLSGGLMQ